MTIGCWVPQTIMLLSVIFNLTSKHTVLKTGVDGVAYILGLLLMYWGGFFDCLLTQLKLWLS